MEISEETISKLIKYYEDLKDTYENMHTVYNPSDEYYNQLQLEEEKVYVIEHILDILDIEY